MSDQTAPAPDPEATLRSRAFIGLIVLAAVVGLAVSLASWGFLEGVHQLQVLIFTDLPRDLGYHDGPPLWFYLPVLAVGGLIAAFAIERLPGNGGHVPADGLKTGTTEPSWLPGVMLAAIATLAFGAVLGPEAPLIALGAGLGIFAMRRARGDAPEQAQALVAATGSFASMAMIFDSPLIAAVLLIEAAAIGGMRQRLVVVPGLLGSGIGSLVAIGMGSWTGLDTSAYSLGALTLPQLERPTAADFGWTLLLAPAVALVAAAVVRSGKQLHEVVKRRAFVLLPISGLAIAGLAIAFAETTDKDAQQVLFSGQDALDPLSAQAATWSLSALALLLVFKGLAWSISLAGFRGGPTFPAIFLGAAGGLMASHLPGFSLTAAVGVGMASAVVCVLRLPLSAVVIGALLTAKSGPGTTPLMIVGVVVAYLATLALDRFHAVAPEAPGRRGRSPSGRPARAAPSRGV